MSDFVTVWNCLGDFEKYGIVPTVGQVDDPTEKEKKEVGWPEFRNMSFDAHRDLYIFKALTWCLCDFIVYLAPSEILQTLFYIYREAP